MVGLQMCHYVLMTALNAITQSCHQNVVTPLLHYYHSIPQAQQPAAACRALACWDTS